jgi:hypothetical protein
MWSGSAVRAFGLLRVEERGWVVTGWNLHYGQTYTAAQRPVAQAAPITGANSTKFGPSHDTWGLRRRGTRPEGRGVAPRRTR